MIYVSDFSDIRDVTDITNVLYGWPTPPYVESDIPYALFYA